MQVLHVTTILSLGSVHESHVITGKDRCGVAKHFFIKCTNGNKVENIKIQLTEQVEKGNYDLEGKLWCRGKYWQTQLFTLSNGINSTWYGIVPIEKATEKRKS